MADDERSENTLLPESVLANSPSRHRVWACELIQEAGILLKLPQVVMCTAQNVLHRFLYRKSLKRFDGFMVALGSFFLACKIEEKPKRIRETVMAFHFIWKRRTRQAGEKLELGGPRYNAWKAELIKMERHILKELGFSFYVIDHAHKFILFYIKFLDGDRALAQKAWSYLNDSMRTDFCLRARAEVIACAAIFMAARALQVKLPSSDEASWWDVFHVRKAEMDEAVAAILNLYAQPRLTWLEALTPRPHITDDDFDSVQSRAGAPTTKKPPPPPPPAPPASSASSKADDAKSDNKSPRPGRDSKDSSKARRSSSKDRDRDRRDRDRRDRDRDRRDRDRDRKSDRDDRRRSKRSPDAEKRDSKRTRQD